MTPELIWGRRQPGGGGGGGKVLQVDGISKVKEVGKIFMGKEEKLVAVFEGWSSKSRRGDKTEAREVSKIQGPVPLVITIIANTENAYSVKQTPYLG